MRIRPAAIDAIVAHARADAPFECCGLLLGSETEIDEAVAVENLRRSPVAYRVDPAGHFAAIRQARATGRAVVGAYHSHTRSPAVPSATDVSEANDPTLLHVIVSLATDEPCIRAYRIAEARVEEIELRQA